MNQNQSFHTANYRGNQPGHDNYLRSDSQQASSYGTAVSSQYRGNQSAFQPTGAVQSAYGQNQQLRNQQQQQWNQPQQQFANRFTNQVQAGQFSGFQSSNAQSPQSYHTANYMGNQPGHDNYLRADATSPSQSAGAGQFGAAGSAMRANQYGTSANQLTNQNQYSNPQSYHTANYVGNQPGHDNYLRADATSPSQSGGASQYASSGFGGANQFGSAANQFGAATNQFGANQFGAAANQRSWAMNQMGAGNQSSAAAFRANAAGQSQNQAQSQQAFQTAFGGNQQG